jgi:hypothetical protein
MVINLTDSEQRVAMQVRGVKLSKAETWLLDALHNAENLGNQALPVEAGLDLPAQSIYLFVIGK